MCVKNGLLCLLPHLLGINEQNADVSVLANMAPHLPLYHGLTKVLIFATSLFFTPLYVYFVSSLFYLYS